MTAEEISADKWKADGDDSIWAGLMNRNHSRGYHQGGNKCMGRGRERSRKEVKGVKAAAAFVLRGLCLRWDSDTLDISIMREVISARNESCLD